MEDPPPIVASSEREDNLEKISGTTRRFPRNGDETISFHIIDDVKKNFKSLHIETPPLTPTSRANYKLTPMSPRSKTPKSIEDVVPGVHMKNLLEKQVDENLDPVEETSSESSHNEDMEDGKRHLRDVRSRMKKEVRFAPDVKVNYSSTYYERHKTSAFYQFHKVECRCCFCIHLLILTFVIVGVISLIFQGASTECLIPSEISVGINILYLLGIWIFFNIHLFSRCICRIADFGRIKQKRRNMSKKVEQFKRRFEESKSKKVDHTSLSSTSNEQQEEESDPETESSPSPSEEENDSQSTSTNSTTTTTTTSSEEEEIMEEEEEGGTEVLVSFSSKNSLTSSSSNTSVSTTSSLPSSITDDDEEEEEEESMKKKKNHLLSVEDESDLLSDDKTRGLEEEEEKKKKKKFRIHKKKKIPETTKKKKKVVKIRIKEEEEIEIEPPPPPPEEDNEDRKDRIAYIRGLRKKKQLVRRDSVKVSKLRKMSKKSPRKILGKIKSNWTLRNQQEDESEDQEEQEEKKKKRKKKKKKKKELLEEEIIQKFEFHYGTDGRISYCSKQRLEEEYGVDIINPKYPTSILQHRKKKKRKKNKRRRIRRRSEIGQSQIIINVCESSNSGEEEEVHVPTTTFSSPTIIEEGVSVKEKFFEDTIRKIRKGEVEMKGLREESHPYNWEWVGMLLRKLPHPFYGAWEVYNGCFCVFWLCFGFLPHLSPVFAFINIPCSVDSSNPSLVIVGLVMYVVVLLAQIIQFFWFVLSIK